MLSWNWQSLVIKPSDTHRVSTLVPTCWQVSSHCLILPWAEMPHRQDLFIMSIDEWEGRKEVASAGHILIIKASTEEPICAAQMLIAKLQRSGNWWGNIPALGHVPLRVVERISQNYPTDLRLQSCSVYPSSPPAVGWLPGTLAPWHFQLTVCTQHLLLCPEKSSPQKMVANIWVSNFTACKKNTWRAWVGLWEHLLQPHHCIWGTILLELHTRVDPQLVA